MITNDSIKKIVAKCSAKGHEIKVQDISFLLLCEYYEDASVSYKSIFGSTATDSEMTEYVESAKMRYLKTLVDKETNTTSTIDESDMSLTFEENRAAMIRMIDELKDALDNKEIEYKEYSDRVTKLRIALNDKFRVADSTIKQFVIVEPKFNHICEWTHHECFLQTEKYAREHWGLCKKSEVLDEIKKEYILTPKKKK